MNKVSRTFFMTAAILTCSILTAGCFTNPEEDSSAADNKNILENHSEFFTEENITEQNMTDKSEQKDADENGYHWLSETVFTYDLGDLDQNGTAEYVEIDTESKLPDYESRFTFYWNNEPIYEYADFCRITPGDAEYLDLDQDGEKEIFFPFYPWVNSMPLEEYIVLKQIDGTWKPLEMIHGNTMMDNAFPLSVTKGKEKWSAVIACDELEKTIVYDVELHYLDLKKEFQNYPDNEFLQTLTDRYTKEFVFYPEGEIAGEIAAWGIWNIQSGEYNGYPCLIASHGIECFGKDDFWGIADIYFDYDTQGKTRFLDIQFHPQYTYTEQTSESTEPVDIQQTSGEETVSANPQHNTSLEQTSQAEENMHITETSERVYKSSTPGGAYADIAEIYYKTGMYAQKVKDTIKAMAAAENSYICDEYLVSMCSSEGSPVPVYVLHDLNDDGIEEFFIGIRFNYSTPYYEIYDVYTWKEGRAYQLMRGIGYRNGSCTICKNGIIQDHYSGSAWDWFTLYHILPKEGTALETIDKVASGAGMEGSIYYHQDEIVDENTIQTIMEQYEEESVAYIDCNPQTIETLRNR